MNNSSRKYRIGFVSTMSGIAWGGSEQLWSDTALELRRRGHHVSASVLRWPTRPAPLDELARHGVPVAFRRRRPHWLGRALQKCLRQSSSGALQFSHRWWLRRSAADLIVISQGGPWDGVPWMLACRERGVPYCGIVQANSELWWPLDRHLDGIRAATAGAQRMYFVSHANRRLMELQCGAPLGNAEVIANPCKVDRSASVPWPEDTEGRLRLACVGRMSPNAKGQDVLLEVLAQPKWKSRPVELHLYGAGPSERSIASLVTLLGLANVFFHGHVSEVRDIWRANHALVLPSRFEGLPLTIVEAMLCGRLAITTAVAGNTEIVEDGANGFVAAAPTVALLDEAMERAWACRARWQEIGLRARADALRSVPSDPVGDFTGKLLSVIENTRTVAKVAGTAVRPAASGRANPIANSTRAVATPNPAAQ
jgi:glycosyltransferase involved in cell wall biosynthesis